MIHNMINKLSNTPFKINTELLDYIILDKQGLLLNTYESIPYSDILKRSKSQDKIYKGHITNLTVQENILKIADLFRNVDKIYFPVRCDQRGRIYCTPNYLNYQSTELAKSLLLFSEPSLITRNDSSIKYLMGYGVNCFGGVISKGSLENKVKWVENNIKNILNYDNGILLSKAKDKLLFLSFCLEYKRYFDFYHDEDLETFYTYLPVQLDATCNGFQHMALLSNKTELFEELNLTTNSSQPKDFYNFLLHKVKDILCEKVDNGIEFDDSTNSKPKRKVKPLYSKSKVNRLDKSSGFNMIVSNVNNLSVDSKVKNLKVDSNLIGEGEELEDSKGSYVRLKEFIWDRQLLKKAIMTIPYNSTQFTQVVYIKDSLIEEEINGEWWYHDKSNKSIKISTKDIFLLIKIISNIVFKDYPKISKMSQYLKNVSKLMSALSLPIYWYLPNGLNVYQSYLEVKSTTISPFTFSKVRLNINIPNDTLLDSRKQSLALMPYLIHSLDATSLSLLYNNLCFIYKDIQFYSVHDCFGITFDKVPTLKVILASIYTEIYCDDNYLKKFDNNILDFITSSTNSIIDRKNRLVILPNEDIFELHSIDWVLNNEYRDSKTVKRINDQHIVI